MVSPSSHLPTHFIFFALEMKLKLTSFVIILVFPPRYTFHFNGVKTVTIKRTEIDETELFQKIVEN